MSELRPIDENKQNKPTKKIKAHHKKIIYETLSLVHATRMDETLKMIVRMRIWGKNPNHYDPMNHIEIAVDLGAKEYQVREWEQEAKFYMKQYLKMNTIADAMGKMDEDATTKADKLFTPGGRIIKP